MNIFNKNKPHLLLIHFGFETIQINKIVGKERITLNL